MIEVTDKMVDAARRVLLEMFSAPDGLVDSIVRDMLGAALAAHEPVDAPDASYERPRLGLATTGELLEELRARIKMHALGGLNYRTVDDERLAIDASTGIIKP